MILDKKLIGILSQEDRALQIFEPSESDKVYEVRPSFPFLKGYPFTLGLFGNDRCSGRRRCISLQKSWKIEVTAIRRITSSRLYFSLEKTPRIKAFLMKKTLYACTVITSSNFNITCKNQDQLICFNENYRRQDWNSLWRVFISKKIFFPGNAEI